MIPSFRMVEKPGGSGSQEDGGVCVADRFRGIALTLVVCKVFCHILKEKLATVVEEYNLVVEEQGGFRRGRGCRDQIVSLILLGQTKVALQEDG